MDRFDYALPPDQIAQRPPARRDGSRLLILGRGSGTHRDARFPDIVDVLRPGDLLVVNETAVFPARLWARRAGGGRTEILLTRPLDGADPESAAGHVWEALVRPARRTQPGDRLELLAGDGAPSGAMAMIEAEAEAPAARRVRLDVPGDPWAWIASHGHVPLPPYIARADEPSDRERYQTVYAQRRGAVAAPTAGLHFTAELLARLAERGIRRAAITLHVGPGTFRPVVAEHAEDHAVEAEWFEIPAATAAALGAARAGGGRIVAVGTTSVRALESAARGWGAGQPAAASGWSDLTILPGHAFRWVDALLTNFHLPRSSLLLLVAAFAGTDRVLGAYRHAVTTGYRFYSYGDAMLIV